MEWIEAKTIVTRNRSVNWNYLAAEYTMNIYRGCSHGCIYCFARSSYYHIDDFDRVRAKKDALRIIRDDLRRKVKSGIVMTGGMSDPYNPQEEEHQLTRHSLELINAYSFGACILTKSSLVTRDLDILTDIREHSPVSVNFSITCCSDELSKQMEPHVAASSERFHAMEHLAKNGVTAGVLLDPVVPFLTDTPENIREIVKQAKARGASYIYISTRVTMEGIQREHFYREAEKISPGISQLYSKRYKEYYYCPSPRAQKLWQAFVEECENQKLIYNMEAANNKIRGNYHLSSLQTKL